MKNLILIGMPGTGKSAVGKELARRLEYTFLDVDDVIRERTGKTLKELLEAGGVDAFIRLEGGIILDFRIAWAMNVDTPGDTIILGTKGGLRIPSTDCWNGSVGGPMTIYKTIGGINYETQVPIINDGGPSLFDRKIRSFLDACKTGGKAPVPTSQIIYNQAIIDGIIRSSACGHEVEVDL